MRRNTLSAGLQHLNWKFNVFLHRKTVIYAFGFVFCHWLFELPDIFDDLC